MKTAFLKDGTLVFLKIIGHIKTGLKIGIDKYGKIWIYCEVDMSASAEYEPELDGPIKFDV